ncbi:NADH dehydrogenase [ubiquinone] 1 alpha subcomplex subunit 10, mitochondrial [Phymastichus coffea]|uniref:NADH dehydrogenase [ubiquinone] 1 alpha subcomplex subunit 10, mitochondrial n=1 Tax=Phymastichus coffea TaxID=108790 RepID=UPI00273A7F0A|nr:NADH dehydrogenase [ubiquinone] 1 alpha subcomplex subunit 10, mitochondrial [Phymastichus coffea]
MFVALRSGLTAKFPFSTIGKELCKVVSKNKFQVATLTRAAWRDEDEVPLIKPFPYHEKEYTVLTMLMDVHKCRVHKHSKLIVLDGPPAIGKNKLAKELAKEFDFLYLPQPTFDDLYVTYWGFDVRSLDPKLPENARTWDIERWLHNPSHVNTCSMQMYMYLLRQKLWMNCLAHILCTGQGVVTVRSPWSDAVFAKAMCKNKYLTPKGLEYHEDALDASLHFYLRPHLVIYLDAPVSTIQQNIKKRGLPHEKNNKALTDKFLTDLEESYKSDYLAKISEHSHLLIYDWSQGGDTEIVLEDIESLNFDDIPDKELLLSDWRFEPFQYKIHIKHYTYDSDMYLMNMDIARTDVPEMILSPEDWKAFDNVWYNIPDSKYDPGYNILKGDKDVLWKDKFILAKDHVTPLIQKYYERKQKLKSG